jgi:hypothetical protein
MLYAFERLLDNSSDAMHRPLFRDKSSKWIGVEIECLLDGDDECDDSSCESCEGSGEHTCSDCEGDGTLTLTHRNSGQEHEVDCQSCEGSGTQECGNCDGPSSRRSNSSIRETIRSKLRKAKITRASVKSDGSLSGDGKIGVEVTILFDSSKGFDVLYKTCKILNDLGAEINSTCGLHVHIDQFNNSAQESIALGKKFGRFLPVLSQLIPKSRRTNTYCRLAVSELRGERYFAVNMTALSEHQTIEIRLHSGTTSAAKIQNWVELLHAIVASDSHRNVSTFQGLIDELNLKSELIEYFDKRHQKFNPEYVAPTLGEKIIDLSDDESCGQETESIDDLTPIQIGA